MNAGRTSVLLAMATVALMLVPTVSATTVPGTWQPQCSSSICTPPSARSFVHMVYDAHDGYTLLFGGHIGSGGNPSAIGGDTWTFKDGVWTNITSTLSISPYARDAYALAYDAADGYVVLFGGYIQTDICNAPPPCARLLSDTWKFSGGQWTNITSGIAPSSRVYSMVDTDANVSGVLLFGGLGGQTGFSLLSDTWKFSAGVWTNITSTTTGAPPPMISGSMVYDAADHYSILTAGTRNGLTNFGTWKFSGTTVGGTWTNITGTEQPMATSDAFMAYDSHNGSAILFGGFSPKFRALSETWRFAGGAWTNLTSSLTVAPPASTTGAVVFDPVANYTLIFGGYTSSGLDGQTWSFTQTTTSSSGVGTTTSAAPLLSTGDWIVIGVVVAAAAVVSVTLVLTRKKKLK